MKTKLIFTLIMLAAATSYGAIPAFDDNFEAYHEGLNFVTATNGWQASGTAAYVTNGLGYLNSKAVILGEAVALTNTLSASPDANLKVWTDFLITPILGADLTILPTNTASIMGYFNSSGVVCIATASGWLICTNDVWGNPVTPLTNAAYALRVYEGQGRNESLLWPPETPAAGEVYRNFLTQFLPELKAFCAKEKILTASYFHVSDEPHGDVARENYVKARALLKELAPWLQVMDALSEIEYGRNKLADMPIPVISTALDFVGEGIPCWCYYCCGPRGPYLNRLLDTPLAKIRMNGWLFYRWPFQGFLHWGYNYWYQSQTKILLDPFTVLDGGTWPVWSYGDTFLVYPGEQGPIDSLRHEAFADSLQEYALLQTLGIDRKNRLLASLKSFQDFPKTEAWILKTRKALFMHQANSFLRVS